MRIAECGLQTAVRRARSVVVVSADVNTQIRQNARQVEHHRQGVLALGDPCHRLDRHRVQREKHARQPRAGNSEPEQHAPEQHGAHRVQQHVDQVVAERVLSPQTPLEPEHAGGQREVVRRRRGEPELAEAVGSVDERVLRQEDAIVPDEPGAAHRRVGEQRRADDQDGRKEAAHGGRALRDAPRQFLACGRRFRAGTCQMAALHTMVEITF